MVKNFLEKYEGKEADSPAATVRLIHTVKFDFSKKLDDVEEKVNLEILNLAKHGCKIVSITSKQVGFQPMYLLYDIIYEPGEQLTKCMIETL